MIGADDQVIQTEVTLEEKIIYDKLTGRLPIRRIDADLAKEWETETVAAPDGAVSGQTASEEEKTAQYLWEICQRLDIMDATRENLAFRPIYSCRRFIGWLIVFFKRVVRKCLKWYLEPVCFQQTDFNNAVTPAIGRLTELHQFSFKKIQHLEKNLAAREVELERLKNEIQESINAQIHSLRQPVESKLATISEDYTVLIDSLKEIEQKYAKVIQQQNQLSQTQSECIERAVTRFHALEDRLLQSEQINQTHGGYIERLTVDHNGRLDELEDHFSSLEKHCNTRIGATEKLLQVLEDEGAFISADREQQIRRSSLSQSGEDAILAQIFKMLGMAESQCSYLDLGANHAKKLSNTYYFYQKGSRGVLVEANPKLIAELKFYRSGDVILNRCIAGESGQNVDFYLMSGDGLSTPDKEQAERIVSYNPAIQIENVVAVQTISVNEILDTYFDGAPVFINIDIEGAEMEILTSIDFEAHRPLAIILEMIPYRSHLVVGVKNQEILQFMTDNDYMEYAFTGINSIFLDKKQMRNLGVLE